MAAALPKAKQLSYGRKDQAQAKLDSGYDGHAKKWRFNPATLLAQITSETGCGEKPVQKFLATALPSVLDGIARAWYSEKACAPSDDDVGAFAKEYGLKEQRVKAFVKRMKTSGVTVTDGMAMKLVKAVRGHVLKHGAAPSNEEVMKLLGLAAGAIPEKKLSFMVKQCADVAMALRLRVAACKNPRFKTPARS